MRKILIILAISLFSMNAFCKEISDTEKLYYTCKIWGYMKYFHSEVSYCEFDWNQVLYDILPDILDIDSKEDFNYVMNLLLEYAGSMDIATTEPPEELPIELRRNLDFEWFNDPLISDDVRAKLEEIRDNFRPHEPCWVINSNPNGFINLSFPYDDPILNIDTDIKFPKERLRLIILFSFWNIVKYYNPNNYILDTPWDSTLHQYIEPIRKAEDKATFYSTIQEIASNLDDARSETLTICTSIKRRFTPKILLKYVEGKYIVIKSDIEGVEIGDEVVSVNDVLSQQWAENRRKYISAGNPPVFYRLVSKYLLSDLKYTVADVEFIDKNSNIYSKTFQRIDYYYDDWFWEYHALKELEDIAWKKYDCNIGYVNLDKIFFYQVSEMINEIKDTKAMIFDLRYGNEDNATWKIAEYLYSKKTDFAKFLIPDLLYPGTFYYESQSIGWDNKNNYKGKVIILCDENTQGSMEFCSMILQAAPDATVIGSQTAGTDGNSELFNLTIDLFAGFGFVSVFYPDGAQTQKIGIVPDIEVYPTIEGIKKGRDEVLEKALEVAGCGASSVDEDEVSEDEISTYPNPAENEIIVSGVYGKTKIYNIYGNEEWQGVLEENRRINLQGLSSGVYYIVINNKFVKSFVVVR
jgi:hypothetical protein